MCLSSASVVTASKTAILWQRDHTHGRVPLPKVRDRTVGGCVVDDDRFNSNVLLRSNGVEARVQMLTPIPRHDDNRDVRWCHVVRAAFRLVGFLARTIQVR